MNRPLALAFIGIASMLPMFGQNYKVLQTIQIGGSGGWDYLKADSNNRRLYVSHGTEVVVLDLDTQKITGHITGLSGIHGIAIDSKAGKGFISDGRANEVAVFDLNTLTIQNRVKAGQNPDAIIYDAGSDKVFAFNGRSQDISVIDPNAGTVTATLPAGGKPEFAASDGQGNVYFNVEDKNEIGHIDSKAMTVKEHWSIAPCDSPSGLAIDIDGNRLFSVCGNEKMIIVDPSSGKVLATPAIGKGPDAAAFDPGAKLAFSSNGQDGTLTIVKDEKPVQTIPTARGARTMALDEKTHRIYLATASFGPSPASTPQQPHPRPSIEPGSFRLVVAGPQ